MKKLRRKIVIGVFLSALAVFLLTVVLIGMAMNLRVAHRADEMTDLIVKYDGEFPDREDYDRMDPKLKQTLGSFDEESPYRLRYFSVFFDGDILKSEISHIAAVNMEEAAEMAADVRTGVKKRGYVGDYRYRIDDDKQMVVFLDVSDDILAAEELVLILALISIVFVLMITTVFWFLSKRIVRPFEENSQMQKQFITDASHELKTPLAIISANAEVLAYKDGENEWIKNITTQVTRVSELVNELLTLNRLEEVNEISDIESVDLSQKVNSAADTFAEVFKSKNVALYRDIQPDVVINGNASQLERLVSVLTENASKYVSENGEVRITLKKDAHHTMLSVFNTCEIDKSVDYTHLFDRFYRPDHSRDSNTGGHGIGLSIAKRITVLHGGTIEAVPSDSGLTFNVKLSNKLKIKSSNKHFKLSS